MRIIVIYSLDEDLCFLEPLVENLYTLYNSNIEIYRLTTEMHSHSEAEKIIKESPDQTLIIFLCHGGSNYILGNRNVNGLDCDTDCLEFLCAKNIDIIENKYLICLSCNSREGLANLVINNGGLSFIGFGDIRFDDPFFKHASVDKQVKSLAQEQMVVVLIETFKLSIMHEATFIDFVNYFKLCTNKRCDELLLNGTKDTETIRVANFLWSLKDEIMFLGDGDSKIIF